ncbi:TldD/PmbA family protein [bacterium]|nr:TldD/PmbA family protein [bacterium]
MNKDWLKETIDLVSKRKKVEDARILLSVENENLSRFAENRITQNTTRHRINVNVIAVNKHRRGMAETSDVSSRGVLAALRRAEAIVKATPEDPEYIELPQGQRYLKVERFCDKTAKISVDAKARVIREITAEAASRKTTSSGIYRSGDYGLYIGNTRGLMAEHVWTEAEFSITAQTSDSSGSAVAQDEDVSKINPQALAIEAFRTEELGRNPKEVKPGIYKTLITARSVAELLPFAVFQMDRRAADEGRSFFKDKLGKKIISSKIDLISDPADARNPGIPMDLYNDGIARKKTAYIEKGVLTNLWTSRYWAKKQKIPVVTSSFNFSMTGGNKNLDEMIRKIDKGLLVMNLWYIRYVNPMDLVLTGTSRDGFFWIEDGRIKHAVKHMRFNDSPIRILKNPSALGAPERRQGSMLVPSVLVDDFNWASGTTF